MVEYLTRNKKDAPERIEKIALIRIDRRTRWVGPNRSRKKATMLKMMTKKQFAMMHFMTNTIDGVTQSYRTETSST